MDYENYVESYPSFPKENIVFWDFTYLLQDVDARNNAIKDMVNFLKNKGITKIAAIESKGFTIGSIVAHEMQLPLVLIRKPNLIPGEIFREEFIKEYGTGEYQIKKDSVNDQDRVAIIYDIMAGSGASQATVNLIKKCGGKVGSLVYVTELEYLNGRKDLEEHDIFSLVKVSKNND